MNTNTDGVSAMSAELGHNDAEPLPTNEQWRKAVDGLGMLRVFLVGFKQSEDCKSNGMAPEVQGWIDGISELYRLYDLVA